MTAINRTKLARDIKDYDDYDFLIKRNLIRISAKALGSDLGRGFGFGSRPRLWARISAKAFTIVTGKIWYFGKCNNVFGNRTC
jgi:hypothetical protein